jgi:hypothetical protein
VLVLLAGLGAGGASAKTVLPAFHSPSGNIRCFLGTTLHCAVAHADFAQALQHRCITGPSLDWHGFELPAAGRGRITCSGGILYDPETEQPRYVNLPYGTTWRRGGFTCRSATAGMTCRNRGGHGLFLSRQSWRAF